jgi:Mlc titration factor MtfA (ptsG expression regulator)
VGWFSRWREGRILRQATLDPALWRSTVERYACTRALAEDERGRLKDIVVLFLHHKRIHGAGGMAVRDEVRIAIAAQACILVLNLGVEYFGDWVEIIVYPDEFVAQYEYVDAAGVAHQVEEPMTGESWERGPVILSWADAEEGGARGAPAYNVVIHEFAHKLDMRNGEANGFPPLHANMSRTRWSDAFTFAYRDFCDRLDSGLDVAIDAYGAESPAEFFAVVSETFFESPVELLDAYPAVYEQLAQFYRQDPAARLRSHGRTPEQAGARA